MLEKLFRRFPLLRKTYLGLLRECSSKLSENQGEKVVEKDWRNLLILDACRYDDILEYREPINGEIKKITSLGSNTPEWLENNFSDDCSDIVAVAGNPYYSREKIRDITGGNPFHHIENVWDYGWDEELETVLPSEMNKAALQMRNRFPEKRLLVHYMQPHFPFLSRPDLTKRSYPLWDDPRNKDTFKNKIILKLSSKFPELKGFWQHTSPWNLIKDGKVDIAEFKEAHEENLKIVLKKAKKLSKELDGKTVISSDHGELFGEFWAYGHSRGTRLKELIEVPWIEMKD